MPPLDQRDESGGLVSSLERAAALGVARAVRLGALAAAALAAAAIAAPLAAASLAAATIATAIATTSRLPVTAAMRAAEGEWAWTCRARAALNLAPPAAAMANAKWRPARLARLGRLVAAGVLTSLAAAVTDAERRPAGYRAPVALRLLATPATT